MSQGAAEAYDEGMAAFFVQNLSGEADLVYRLGYGITHSKAGAESLVMETFQKMAGELTEVYRMDGIQMRIHVLTRAWEIFSNSSRTYQEEDDEALHFLRKLPSDECAILLFVDALGLNPAEVADVMKVEETDVRKHLANARKKLISHSF